MVVAALASWLLLPLTCASSKDVVVHIGTKYESPMDLDIRPTIDKSSKSGFLVPVNVKQAASELEKMLSPAVLKKILNKSGMESDFLTRDEKSIDLGSWIYENWSLANPDSELGRELKGLGFETQEWVTRALFEAVFEKHFPAANSDMGRLRRFAFIEMQDAMRPGSAPPRECTANTSRVQSKDIWLGEADRWPYGRIISWVDCANGSKRAYLWEREWFVPDPTLLVKLKNNDVM
ncbi:MAG: DUF6794 domain-containing protein [Dokdonella sp.]